MEDQLVAGDRVLIVVATSVGIQSLRAKPGAKAKWVQTTTLKVSPVFVVDPEAFTISGHQLVNLVVGAVHQLICIYIYTYIYI